MYLCKLRGKFFDNEKSLHYFCANFELQRNENTDEEMTPANFLWLIVFVLVFLCALFAILEYSGIINYLSGLI
jgi:nucleoside permease NupC